MKVSFALSIVLAGMAHATCKSDLKICKAELDDHAAYKDPVCPRDDKFIRVAGDEAYRLFCDSKDGGSNRITTVNAATLYECMDECNDLVNCASGDWDVATNDCNLFVDGVGNNWMQSHKGKHSFYQIGRVSP